MPRVLDYPEITNNEIFEDNVLLIDTINGTKSAKFSEFTEAVKRKIEDDGGAYHKPVTGIPEEDLSEDVREKLVPKETIDEMNNYLLGFVNQIEPKVPAGYYWGTTEDGSAWLPMSGGGSGSDVFVTPEMFGAKDDGVTDASTAIKNALESGKMVFLDKTYKVNNAITVTKKCNIVGSGKLIIGNKIDFMEGVALEGITFDASASISKRPISIYKECKIDRCIFTGGGAYDGFLTVSGATGYIINSEMHDNINGRIGIELTNVNAFIISHNKIANIGSSAIEVFFDSHNVLISENMIYNATVNTSLTDGVISTYGDYTTGNIATNIIVENNVVVNDLNCKSFCRVNGVDDFVLRGNTFVSNADSISTTMILVQDRTDHDIKVRNKHVMIENNVVRCKASTSSFVSITGEDEELDVAIISNKVNGKMSGIGFGSSSAPCVGKLTVKGNDMDLTGDAFVSSANSNNTCVLTIADNIISYTGRIYAYTSGLIAIINNVLASIGNHMVATYVSEKQLVKGNILYNSAQNPDVFKGSGEYIETPVNTLVRL